MPGQSEMKLVSWNVNGVRAILKKGFLKTVEKMSPYIILLQETKTGGDIQVVLPGYAPYWSHAERAGYAGTAMFSKEKPLSVKYGMEIPKHDKEGRIIVAEFTKFFLVNVYTPNSGRGLPRHSYRQDWDRAFLNFMRSLEKRKPIIVGGDLNVAHEEIDLARPKDNHRTAGFTDEERAGFSQYIAAGFIDTLREFNKSPGQYTYWGQWNNLRERNIGWRIDYFLISSSLRPMLKDAFIVPEITGSDHCPVGIILS
jgi:exodeoxyribonuclease III